MSISHNSTIRTAIADLVVDTIDQGSAAGKIKFYTAGFGTLMGTGTFADPAFDGAASGSANTVSGTITVPITSVGTNTMAVFEITDSDDTRLIDGSVGTAGADINLSSIVFNQGDSAVINSLTYTACP